MNFNLEHQGHNVVPIASLVQPDWLYRWLCRDCRKAWWDLDIDALREEEVEHVRPDDRDPS